MYHCQTEFEKFLCTLWLKVKDTEILHQPRYWYNTTPDKRSILKVIFLILENTLVFIALDTALFSTKKYLYFS